MNNKIHTQNKACCLANFSHKAQLIFCKIVCYILFSESAVPYLFTTFLKEAFVADYL